jgi:hypothetical protein
MTEEEFVKEIESIAKNLDTFIAGEIEKDGDKFSLDLYKYALAFARVGVDNGIDVEHYMKACFDMYIRVGGNVGGDSLSSREEVPSEDDKEGKSKWLH